MKKSRLKEGGRDVSVTEIEKSEINHLNRQIPPLAHTPMYLWHKYWSRKTWNVVAEFIKTYCPEGGIVFDPFAGSGITAMEALRNGRRVIVADLNPIATEIIRLTIKPVDQIKLHEAFERVEKNVKDKIQSLYLTMCRNCKKEIVFDGAVWKEDKCIEIRYQSCPYCEDRQGKDCKPIAHDQAMLDKIATRKIKEWYPQNKLYYPDGRPFIKREKYESVDELFTKRNLQALAWLIEAIEEEPDNNLRDFLKIAFSSMIHLCSRMVAISNPLSASFQNMFKVLKPERYLTLTFHNPTFKVRNATIRAGVFAGFEFQKIHHQPLGQVSAKAMMQPFGSAQGDFYLRFKKPAFKTKVAHPEEIDEVRFERIVVETTIALLAERAEPTPYTIIINYIDPVLAKHGYFSSLHTGLDVNTVLRNHLDKEFALLPTKIGSAEGKLWWFKDVSIVPRLHEIPLTERVEQTVYRKLYQKGKVTFTEVWDAVSTEFPNSLTSDSTSILDALKIYARQVSGGYWMLKPEIHQRINQHSEMIAILAMIGKKQGYGIWIGRREQRERDNGLEGRKLVDYMTMQGLKVSNATNQDVIENLDLLWIKGDEIAAVFEVESTTSMMSAIMRGSNVDASVDKFMVLPEERETQLNNKMTSPLFREHFETENWKIIFFDALRAAYVKEKAALDIHSIVKKKIAAGLFAKEAVKDQGRLF